MKELKVRLITESPLNIGSGAQQGTLARQGMLKDRDGWPYIPASAFKGRLRHAVERVAQALELSPPVCTTHHDMCRRQLCAVCRLFGSPWSAGTVIFNDLTLEGPDEVRVLRKGRAGGAGARSRPRKTHPRTSERTSVSINRRRRVAEDALLFSTELLWPGIELEYGGKLQGDITLAQAGLLVAGLKLLPAMGQGKSGGLGWVRATATLTEEQAEGETKSWDEDQLRQALEEVLATGEAL